MARLIAHPFRVERGKVVKQAQFDDEYKAGQIAILCSTQPRERPLVPAYGVSDPAFAGFDENILRTQVGIFGPTVIIDSVGISTTDDGLQTVQVAFHSQNSVSSRGFADDTEEDA